MAASSADLVVRMSPLGDDVVLSAPRCSCSPANWGFVR